MPVGLIILKFAVVPLFHKRLPGIGRSILNATGDDIALRRTSTACTFTEGIPSLKSQNTTASMTSLVSCTRVEIVRHVRPQMGYILQYLLSLLGFASSICHLLESKGERRWRSFHGGGLMLVMHLQCRLSNIRGNLLSEYLSIFCQHRRFPPEVQPTRKVGKYFKRFVKCWTLKFRFYLSLSSIVHSQDIRRKRQCADDLLWRSADQNSPFAISRDISLKNPEEQYQMVATRWALP